MRRKIYIKISPIYCGAKTNKYGLVSDVYGALIAWFEEPVKIRNKEEIKKVAERYFEDVEAMFYRGVPSHGFTSYMSRTFNEVAKILGVTVNEVQCEDAHDIEIEIEKNKVEWVHFTSWLSEFL